MKKNKDSSEFSFIRVILVIITIVFTVSLAAVICTRVFLGGCSSVTVDLSLLLSFLSFAFAISIASPYFISNNQVKEVVRNYLENDYKKDIDKSLEDMNRADAHLSRMMSFTLMHQHFYYWAVGWAFRSLKRYKNVKGEYTKTYREFQEMLLRDVIVPSLEDIDNDLSDKIFHVNDKKEIEHLVRRIKIRLVKDYVDFEYEIQKLYEGTPYSKDITGSYLKELEIIRPRMKYVINELEKICLDNGKKLYDEILPISSYKGVDDRKGLIDFIKKSAILTV